MRFLILLVSAAFLGFSAQAQTIQIDFGAQATLPTGWNEGSGLLKSGSNLSLKNSSGAATSYTMSNIESFNSINADGTTSPASSLNLSSFATSDSFYGNSVTWAGGIFPQAQLKISGLNPSIGYSFHIFASRMTTTDTNNRDTQYSIAGATTSTVDLNPTNNTSTIAASSAVKPTSSGTITITIQKGTANNQADGFFYLGSMRILYALPTPTPTPKPTPTPTPKPTPTPTPKPTATPTPTPFATGSTPDGVLPGTALVSLGQTVATASGTINGGVLGANYTAGGAIHYATTPVQPNYQPVSGLVKGITGEYVTGLLMNNGTLQQPGWGGTTTLQEFSLPTGTFLIGGDAGLHNIVMIDSNNTVWTQGTYEDGTRNLSGDGIATDFTGALFHIQNDVNGKSFNNVTEVVCTQYFTVALKGDGTLWIWGDTTGGYGGNGTNGGAVLAPTQVPPPAPGVLFTKVSVGDVIAAIDTNGNVWTWGNNGEYEGTESLGRTGGYETPGMVAGLTDENIVDVHVGNRYVIGLTSGGELYGWGLDTGKLGAGPNTILPANQAVSLQSYLNLPALVQVLGLNGIATHVILKDGSMWGWGDDAFGNVGDGQELDYSKTVVPYAWDWGYDELMVYHPVRIGPTNVTFSAIYENSAEDLYTYAVTNDGHLYTWGRAKTANLFNGIVGANPMAGVISATYPNSWDILVPMMVNPFQYSTMVQVTSPFCLLNPTTTACSTFDNATGLP